MPDPSPRRRRSGNGHLVLSLQLPPGCLYEAVHLDLVGTGKGPVYLGAYGPTGTYHGSIKSSLELLRWLETATERVRMALAKEIDDA